MFIVQTQCKATFQDQLGYGRAGFDRCREESLLPGNQRLCAGAQWLKSQQLVYRTGKAAVRYHRARELQYAEV